ncbi:PAS domain S-box protein [Pararhizobium haloflavum]|uniref:PAS domain S-box protein n=1 Tax=Pararhizobium haloflavum TaxID=2037914 RepID=UPI001FE0DE2E|nr:PAS domain S-box protein [Pararhizobium haloflavum]
MLAAIVESSFDAIVSKDLNSVVTSWNAGAERIFGYSAEEMVGRSITILIPVDQHTEEDEIIARIRRGERIESFETVRVRKDGTPIFVSLTISPIKNARGEIVGASKIARDISATKESERRIRELMREVNHRVKNQFAVILSMIQATARHTADSAQFERGVRERIMALARSHDLLVEANWAGTRLTDLIRAHLKPFGSGDVADIRGPDLVLSSNAVQYLGMALHELGTNAAKYGAFAHGGTVDVAWSIDASAPEAPRLTLSWFETSTPIEDLRIDEAASNPSGGLGSIVLLRITPQALSGETRIERGSDSLTWTLSAPVEALVPRKD